MDDVFMKALSRKAPKSESYRTFELSNEDIPGVEYKKPGEPLSVVLEGTMGPSKDGKAVLRVTRVSVEEADDMGTPSNELHVRTQESNA